MLNRHGIAACRLAEVRQLADHVVLGVLNSHRALGAAHGPPCHSTVNVLDYAEVMRLGDVLVDESGALAFHLAGCQVIRDLAKRERHDLVAIAKENGTGKVHLAVRGIGRLARHLGQHQRSIHRSWALEECHSGFHAVDANVHEAAAGESRVKDIEALARP